MKRIVAALKVWMPKLLISLLYALGKMLIVLLLILTFLFFLLLTSPHAP